MYEDGSTPVIHYNLYDEWFASVGGVKTHAVNMKGIQQHGSKYRVQKRINGELRRWTYDTLTEAVKKRDTIFSKVAAGWQLGSPVLPQDESSAHVRWSYS